MGDTPFDSAMEYLFAVGHSFSMGYESAKQWRDEAMRRDSGIDMAESERRRRMVAEHHAREGTIPDADQLADYELYILGKMDIEEYEAYLVFKYGP